MGRPVLAAILASIITSAVMFFALHFTVGGKMGSPPVEVPQLSSLSPEQARALLEPRGLLLVIDGERPDDRAATGTICEQRPLGGSRLARGAEVHAVLAKPPAPIQVPAVVGQPAAAALAALAAAKLRLGRQSEAPSTEVQKGLVLSTTPAAGTEVKADSNVDLVVSAGPSTQAVPSVVGKSKSSAKNLLEKAGFVVGSTRYGSNDDYDSGQVISQNPTAGSQANPGTKVDLTVND